MFADVLQFAYLVEDPILVPLFRHPAVHEIFDREPQQFLSINVPSNKNSSAHS